MIKMASLADDEIRDRRRSNIRRGRFRSFVREETFS